MRERRSHRRPPKLSSWRRCRRETSGCRTGRGRPLLTRSGTASSLRVVSSCVKGFELVPGAKESALSPARSTEWGRRSVETFPVDSPASSPRLSLLIPHFLSACHLMLQFVFHTISYDQDPVVVKQTFQRLQHNDPKNNNSAIWQL